MLLKDIKNINQRIYELDANISRNNKVIFISTLIFCLKNENFRDPNKLTSTINFVDQNKKPLDQLIELATSEISKLNLNQKTYNAVLNSLNTIFGVNTNLNRDRNLLQKFVYDFITLIYPKIKPGDLFLENLYMEIDKKANGGDKGIVLTPIFAAKLMIDLVELDYKNDVIADLCCGTGLFSLLSYSKMLENLNNDYKNHIINIDDMQKYQKRLFNSIIANDNEPKMVTLCLANFLLNSLNNQLLFNNNVLDLEKSFFKLKNDEGNLENIQPTKAILNPPYEDKYKPLEILEKNISLVKKENIKNNKVVVIIPPQKFGQNKEIFSNILNLSTLEIVIKMQNDLFIDNGKSPSASIFVFNLNKNHSSEDIVRYYNFTDSGYVYLKDSGLVDKNNTFDNKKNILLSKIKNSKIGKIENNFKRIWTNFYEINKESEIEININPDKVKISKEEADITLENQTIKKIISEQESLIKKVNNNFLDKDQKFENYIIDILSEN